MTNPLGNHLEKLLAEFEGQKEKIRDFGTKLASSTTTVTAKNRAIVATVDGQGDLVELKFPTPAFRRMAPAELADAIVETVRAARREARDKAAEMFQSAMPTGAPRLDLLGGPVDFDAAMEKIMATFEDVKRPFEGEGL